MDNIYNSGKKYNTYYKEFKQLNMKDKDRIAEIVETQHKDKLLAPVVDSYIYGSSRAVDYGHLLDRKSNWEHAVNKNHDYFDSVVMHEEIPGRGIQRYETFRSAGMYLDHQSKNVENSIGFIFDAYDVNDNPEDSHITILFGVDKSKAPRVARDLQRYPERVATSMGCRISGVVCTACGESDCDHLKYMKGGRHQGKKVAELLLGVEFFEDSIVSTPACSTAYVLDAISDIVPGRLLKVASESDDGIVTATIIGSIYESIKSAKTSQEKSRLSDQLDYFIQRLSSLATN